MKHKRYRVNELLLRRTQTEAVALDVPTVPHLFSVQTSDRALAVDGVATVAYEVRSWQNISWTASATVGYRTALEERTRQGLSVQAVVCRARPVAPEEAPLLIVTLWSDEGRNGSTWKILGVELPPVN
jgi:hypothetical protein